MYGIKLYWGEEMGWVWLTTEDTSKKLLGCDKIHLFQNKDHAKELADSWRIEGKEKNVQVIKYRDFNDYVCENRPLPENCKF